VAREWGRLQATVANRGGKPRRRNADLAIAATAIVNKAVLVTNNLKDFAIVEDLVEVRAPAQLGE
jgi:predicted nucleic acid-binding protein